MMLISHSTNPPTGPRIATHTQLPLTSVTPELSDKFFANLTLFSAAMISHITDMKTLHQRHIKHTTDEVIIPSLPPSMKVPAIKVPLSEILSGRPAGARKIATWARDFVQIRFKGLEKASSGRSRQLIKPGNGIQLHDIHKENSDLLVTTAEARFRVADPSKFSLLKGNVEQDVAFNSRLGVFALQLRADIGTTMLDDLASRVQAIERLVDCVDAIRRSNSDISCDTITLARVVFTYGDTIGRIVGKETNADTKRWKASLDLRADRIKMSLETGNPHLRVLDCFNQLINSELGFEKVPHYLAFTLPVLKALELVEDSWEGVDSVSQGFVEIFTEHLDWFTIRYTISGPNNGSSKVYRIAVKLRERRGSLFWHITRCEPGPDCNPDDELKVVLAKVWSHPAEGWQNFGDSASCTADYNIITLLTAVDEAVRQFAKQPPSSSPMVSRQAPLKATDQQPTSKMNSQRPMPPNRARSQQQRSGSSSNTAINLD